MQKHIAVLEDLLLDLLAHCVAASRQLGLIDERSVVLAAGAALLNVDHIGRAIAGLVGHSTEPFGREPPRRVGGEHMPPEDDDPFREVGTEPTVVTSVAEVR